MTNTLNFRNSVQVALFVHELSGQISDGMWENSIPHNHWKWLIDLKLEVNPDSLGPNFKISRKYNFANSELIGIIGDRMCNIANLKENGVSDEMISEFNKYSRHCLFLEDDYWVKKRKKFLGYFGTYKDYEKACKGSYDLKKLKRELIDMKNIVNNFSHLKINNHKCKY